MRHLGFRKGSRLLLALAASMGAAAYGLAGSTGAHADPAWGAASNPLVLVGSNTIEDIMNAYSGVGPSPALPGATFHEFTPLHDVTSTGAGTYSQIYSWDALNPFNQTTDCISAKPGFAPIARPNGSGDGVKAISDAIAGIPWSKTSAPACAPQNPAGQVDIGRSSSGPSGMAACPFAGANCLAWVDFARDAVAYAYFIKAGSGVTASQVDHLSLGTLQSVYSSGPPGNGTFTSPAGAADGSGGVTIGACFPQTGSGTAKFWAVNILNLSGGVTEADAAAGAAHCNGIEENGANGFETSASTALASNGASVMVVPFSTGSWISQNNKFALDRSTTGITAGVALGFPDGATSGMLPYTGTAPNEAPNPAFYSSTLYGRELWLDTNNASLNGSLGSSNTPMRHMLGFAGNNYAGASGTSNVSTASTGSGQICTNVSVATILADFGFTSPQSPAACGNETMTVLGTGTGS